MGRAGQSPEDPAGQGRPRSLGDSLQAFCILRVPPTLPAQTSVALSWSDLGEGLIAGTPAPPKGRFLWGCFPLSAPHGPVSWDGLWSCSQGGAGF